MMNTNRKSEVKCSDCNNKLQPPSARQDQPSAGLCLLLLFASQQLVGRGFKRRVQITCGGGKGQDLCGVCVSGRDTQKGSRSLSLTFTWRRAASPVCFFPYPFCSSLSALQHPNLVFRLVPSFCILFLLIFFL